jgi:Retrotransposon gag protein
VNEKFEKVYNKNDVVNLFKIIKDICTNDKAIDCEELEYAFWNIEQGKRTFDEYILDFEEKLKTLKEHNIDISESKQVNIFMRGLDQNAYQQKIMELQANRNSEDYPDSYLRVKEICRVWTVLSDRVNRNNNNNSITAVRGAFVTMAKRECFRCGSKS